MQLSPHQSNEMRRVAFQGERGAFSEDAVLALWPNAEPVPCRTVADVMRAASRGEVGCGVLPIDNTVVGAVVTTHDALVGAPELHVIAEVILEIHQCLAANPGATLRTIEVVESHPVALGQCAAFLAGLPHVREQSASDTAGAARAVAESGDLRRAAIASLRAASRYGLIVLADHVEDRSDNQTRFVAVAPTRAHVAPDTPARTSVVFTTGNAPGALARALDSIARHDLSVSRLESRPAGLPWTSRFFADIDHVAGDPRLDASLASLATTSSTCRILGTYARAIP